MVHQRSSRLLGTKPGSNTRNVSRYEYDCVRMLMAIPCNAPSSVHSVIDAHIEFWHPPGSGVHSGKTVPSASRSVHVSSRYVLRPVAPVARSHTASIPTPLTSAHSLKGAGAQSNTKGQAWKKYSADQRRSKRTGYAPQFTIVQKEAPLMKQRARFR